MFLGIKYQAWNVHMNKPLYKNLQNIYGNKTGKCLVYKHFKTKNIKLNDKHHHEMIAYIKTVVSCFTRFLIFCLNMQIGLSSK